MNCAAFLNGKSREGEPFEGRMPPSDVSVRRFAFVRKRTAGAAGRFPAARDAVVENEPVKAAVERRVAREARFEKQPPSVVVRVEAETRQPAAGIGVQNEGRLAVQRLHPLWLQEN